MPRPKSEIRNKIGTARHFGVSAKVVEGWIAQGMPVVSAPASRNGEYAIDLRAAWRWHADTKLARAGASELDAARARLAKEQADLLKLKLAEMQASLLPAHEAAEAWRWAREQARQILYDMVDATLPALMATATADGPVEQVESAVRQQLVEAFDGALTKLQHSMDDDDGEAESAPAEGSAEQQR